MTATPEISKKAQIWHQILDEREYQDKKWGGPEHDDEHNNHDWVSFIIKHLGRAVVWPFSPKTFRQQMIRVAALAVAAVEWIDRITEE